MHFGWIDFSKSDRDKVLSVLQLFAEQGAVDELGIGSVRDAFANLFFPGTSTIQTRAKYFFIVSYLLQEAGADSKSLDWLASQEQDCCRRLICSAETSGESTVGIIGNTQVDTKGWIKRKPSDIYWTGIKTLGFFDRRYADLSMGEYLRQAELIKKEKEAVKKSSRRNHDENEDPDDNTPVGAVSQFWKIKLEPDWRDNLSMNLTAAEAKLFVENLQQLYPRSVFNLLLKLWTGGELSFPAVAHLVRASADPDTCLMLDYALQFDELVYSARVAYNRILSEETNETANAEWAKIQPQLANIAKINITDIFSRLELNKPATLQFLRKLTQLYADDAPFEKIRELLEAREIDLKGRSRAKLQHPSRENLTWVGGSHLDFRTPRACQIIKDIKHHV